VLSALLAAVALGVPAAESDRRVRPACSAPGSKTLAASVGGRIFARRARDYSPVFGCLYRRNRRVRLGRFRECFDSSAVTLPRLAGRYAGYALENCHRTPRSSAEVVVKNLRNGRTLHRVDGFTGTPAGTPPLYSVTDLELKRNGSIAWIVLSTQAGRRVEVRKSDADGDNRVLDAGGEIELDSLALSASRIYWTKAGRPLSAQLR
jgi:hypothetical protein